jgi:hypothetical protein
MDPEVLVKRPVLAPESVKAGVVTVPVNVGEATEAAPIAAGVIVAVETAVTSPLALTVTTGTVEAAP